MGLPNEEVAAYALGTKDFHIVKDVEKFFAPHKLEHPVAANALAENLGVSRRTLFDAFRKYLAMGPHAYLTLIRLHRLREELLAATTEGSTVTALASALGFNHLGRLSTAYKTLFGEYPRETL